MNTTIIRTLTGFSQQQLADLLGVSKASISHCERGRRSMYNSKLPRFLLHLSEKMVNRKVSLAPCKCLADEQKELDALLNQKLLRHEALKGEIHYNNILLTKMLEAYEQSRSMLDSISIIEAEEHAPEDATRIALWLPMTKAAAEKLYEKNNRARQEKISLHIATMSAELKACEDFIKEHSLAELNHSDANARIINEGTGNNGFSNKLH